MDMRPLLYANASAREIDFNFAIRASDKSCENTFLLRTALGVVCDPMQHPRNVIRFALLTGERFLSSASRGNKTECRLDNEQCGAREAVKA